jgi:hypothetical protein
MTQRLNPVIRSADKRPVCFFYKGVVTCCAKPEDIQKKNITHRIRSKYSLLPMRPHLLKTVAQLKNKKGCQSALNAVDFLNAEKLVNTQFAMLSSNSILIPLHPQFAMPSSYSILIPLDTQYGRGLLNTHTQVKYSMLKV